MTRWPERTTWWAVIGLTVMITWTIVIKYLLPLLDRIARPEAADHLPYLWDAWPVAHAVMAWALVARPRAAWLIAFVVSAAEVGVVVTKFALFLSNPEWDLSRLLWFTNKCYVLAFFAVMTVVLLHPAMRSCLQGSSDDKESNP